MNDDIRPAQPNRAGPNQPLDQQAPKNVISDFVVVNNNQNAKETEKAATEQKQPPSQEPTAKEQTQPQPKLKPKKNRSVTPVVLAVLVLIVLSSLAIYSGLIKQDSPAATPQSDSQNQTSPNTQSDDKVSIDNIIQEIDGLPDNADNSGSKLDDQQLGL